ncbi:PREDICTED: uncharacterized protein LOC106307209 isoform X3 [Brassica oleracea var. oleracea]|uniref:uncharacterized protein LOC106307209 isoform X3 n=1 Tax=Brassica oleracea var. oleracea TaxID=109376 RepID=UPI0006A71F4F|nr:PREDICTED: uncharacterized protein LOC106307209 isoform X3 [Brassica oleracea var. oleracea]
MCCCGGTRRSWCVGVTVGTEVNRGLMFLQDLACRGSLKQFLMAAIGLWLAAMIGSCCNFLTVLYIGFVGAGGVFVCIFLWRIMFGIASTFVGLSEGMAKYGFLVLSSAIVAFASFLRRTWRATVWSGPIFQKVIWSTDTKELKSILPRQ